MLQSKQRLTAREVAGKFGVSIRTVYRDMRALEQAGVPLYAEEGRGYRLVDGYTLAPVALSEREANALVTAERLVARNKDASFVRDYTAAMTKIRAVLHRSTQEKAELLAQRVMFRNNPREDSSSDALATLQLAITNRTPVEVVYQALADQRETHRIIEPLALYSTQENWVLIAWCRLRDDYRSFRLDGIRQIKLLSETFPDRNFNLTDYFEQCREKFYPPDIPLSPDPATFGFSHQNPTKMSHASIESFHVVGLSVRTTNADGQADQDIPALWNTFLSENAADRIPHKVSDDLYAVYTEYEGDHTQPYTMVLGCRVSEADTVPNGMVVTTVPEGRYERVLAKGSLPQGAVYQAWTDIWKSDRDRAYTADFEVYGEKAGDPEDAEVEIYVGLKE